jgi:general secretion pathway protein M
MSHTASLGAWVHAVRATLHNHWQQLTPRERLGVGVLGWLLGIWLVWAVTLQPALQTLHDSAERRAQLAQQLHRMQALQSQAQNLQQQTALSPAEALQRLRQLTPTTDTGLQLNQNNGQVSVQVNAVPATALASWLAQARRQAHALPTEVHLTLANKDGPGASWNGRIVLRLPERESGH